MASAGYQKLVESFSYTRETFVRGVGETMYGFLHTFPCSASFVRHFRRTLWRPTNVAHGTVRIEPNEKEVISGPRSSVRRANELRIHCPFVYLHSFVCIIIVIVVAVVVVGPGERRRRRRLPTDPVRGEISPGQGFFVVVVVLLPPAPCKTKRIIIYIVIIRARVQDQNNTYE